MTRHPHPIPPHLVNPADPQTAKPPVQQPPPRAEPDDDERRHREMLAELRDIRRKLITVEASTNWTIMRWVLLYIAVILGFLTLSSQLGELIDLLGG